MFLRDAYALHADLTDSPSCRAGAPLPLHADERSPSWRRRRSNTIRRRVRPDRHRPAERRPSKDCAPGDKADELLEALRSWSWRLAIPSPVLRSRFETRRSGTRRCASLLGLGQRRGEWQNEGLETRQQTLGYFWRHLRLRQHLLQPGVNRGSITSSSVKPSVTEGIISNAVVTNQAPDTVEL